jgi:hypothetical protein
LMDGMDDVQKAIASTTNVRIVDSAGRPSGSRPGFLLDNSNNEIQARIAYDQMLARAQSAWRGPSTPHAISDATTPALAREAMIKHSENAWRTPNNQVQARDAYGGHVTIPGGDKTQDDLDAEREKAYQERNAKMENAWKTPRNVGFGPGSFGG